MKYENSNPWNPAGITSFNPVQKFSWIPALDPATIHLEMHHIQTGSGKLQQPNLCFPARDNRPCSESGDEADDEHFLLGLPAAKLRLHKGLRNSTEPISGFSTPLLFTAASNQDGHRPTTPLQPLQPLQPRTVARLNRANAEVIRQQRAIFRRCAECAVLASVAFVWQTNTSVKATTRRWSREILSEYALIGSVCILYPLRVAFWTWRNSSKHLFPACPLRLPSSFDPAPLLYPHAVSLLVSALVAPGSKEAVPLSVVLGLCTIPRALVPLADNNLVIDPMHWIITCVPLFMGGYDTQSMRHLEIMVLLYPLHQALVETLQYITTTSLLFSELQLLASALLGLLLLSSSAQMAILRAVLWVGGFMILLTCGTVIQWGITLARVPQWRFRRQSSGSKWLWWGTFNRLVQVRRELMGLESTLSPTSTGGTTDDDEEEATLAERMRNTRVGELPREGYCETAALESHQRKDDTLMTVETAQVVFKRHIFHKLQPLMKLGTHTPSGRKRRSHSAPTRQLFALTLTQAKCLKWIYACYVQVTIIFIVLVCVRLWISRDALQGDEPLGWLLGYIFGGQNHFRWYVVSHNLERWIPLPQREPLNTSHGTLMPFTTGWIPYLRHVVLGDANTRIAIASYWLAVIASGLLLVFRFASAYQVDTRRKVFHFMMVAMLLPATFIDPAFTALALTGALALFLLVDLVRASQLPPFSRPITLFLAPYIDERDLRGPVVVSHIFLLIGCAIPLWLSLGSLSRVGKHGLEAWELATREVAMVAGVICVGMGDAAASLIGRRWGRRKWVWGGGKSLEGSAAFAIAVFLGLMAASGWLRFGGWAVDGATTNLPWLFATRNSAVCGAISSLTEAVLTGGNDNVIVPVLLWTCVKSMGI